MKGNTPIIHLIRGRKMHQGLDKQECKRVHMMDTVATAPKLAITTHHMKR